MKSISFFALILTFIFAPASLTLAQTPTATTSPSDPALTALQAQQAILDTQVKIQQDQQTLATGALPTSSATPNSGAYAVTGSNPFPSQQLAYLELKKISAIVAGKASKPGNVFLYDQTEINNVVNYYAVMKLLMTAKTQVGDLQKDFKDLDGKADRLLHMPQDIAEKAIAPILIPGLALAGLKTASDLIGMFRTNTTISYNSYTVDDAALAAAVVETLKSDGITVYEPAVVPLQPSDGNSALMTILSDVQTTLTTLQYQAGIDQARVQQISDALNLYIQADQASQANQDQIAADTDAGKLAADKVKQSGLDRVREVSRQYVLKLLGAAKTANLDPATANIMKAERDQFLRELAGFASLTTATATAFGTLQTSLTTVSNTGSSAIMAVLRAENLAAKAKIANATILLVKTSVLGGSVVTRTNLFTGGHLLFTGGAIVNYTLFNWAGEVIASGVEIGESGEKKMKY